MLALRRALVVFLALAGAAQPVATSAASQHVATSAASQPVTAAASATRSESITAPGRVVIASDDGGPHRDAADGSADTPAVALPGGGVVAVLGDRSGPPGFDAVELDADGTLDRSFGSGGIARVPVGLPAFSQIEQVVRQADGKLVIVGSGPPAGPSEFAQLVLVRLDPDGTVDQGFGTAGVDPLPIQASCGSCAAAAVRPGGGLVVTGRTGRPSPGPTQMLSTRWVVAGLTPTGALDQNFAQAGILTVPASAGYGLDLAELPDGETVALGGGALGGGRFAEYLTRLLPSGALDASFHGAVPIPLSPGTGTGLTTNPDQSIVVGVNGGLARYTSAGTLDPTFGSNGIAPLGPGKLHQLLAGPGREIVAVLRSGPSSDETTVERLGSGGAVDQTLGGPAGLPLDLPFGGGRSGFVFSEFPRPLPPLAQDTFAASLVARTDGSYLALGGVSVVQPSARADDLSVTDLAVAAFTSSFDPQTGFGGPAQPLQARIGVVREAATTALARHGIAVRLDVSAPGLARIFIKVDHRAVAQSLLPVFAAGPTTVPVELTAYGEAWLARHPRRRLTATVEARDVLTDTATASTSGVLR